MEKSQSHSSEAGSGSSEMPRYFFDFHDGVNTRDDTGMECRDQDHMRKEAKRLLPEIAMDELPRGGEKKNYMVTVRDERDTVVYTAHLDFRGALTES